MPVLLTSRSTVRIVPVRAEAKGARQSEGREESASSLSSFPEAVARGNLPRAEVAVAVRGAYDEKRRSPRARTNVQVTLIVQTHDGRKIGQTVSTIDISPLGVRVRSNGTLMPGHTVELIPAEGSWNSFPCRVVWTSPPGPELFSDSGLEYKTPWTAAKLEAHR
jgi:PilZ domain-containing protein